jgi:hypothetical protein
LAAADVQGPYRGYRGSARLDPAHARPFQTLADGLPNGNWFVVAILPLAIAGAFLGMMWRAARGDLARARNWDESG